MKLMVDITEKQYSKIKEFFDNGFGCYGTKLDEIIYNGIPLSEELEKVKKRNIRRK